MTINEAARILEIGGSDCDPVFYKGIETTIQNLSWNIGDENARKIWIKFHDGTRFRRGTVRSMVLDRVGSM